jgi:uncharacterized membrane protein YfhO
VITRQLQAAEVLSKLSTINDKSSFIKVSLVITKRLVITKQPNLYFNNSSRIPLLQTLFCQLADETSCVPVHKKNSLDKSITMF